MAPFVLTACGQATGPRTDSMAPLGYDAGGLDGALTPDGRFADTVISDGEDVPSPTCDLQTSLLADRRVVLIWSTTGSVTAELRDEMGVLSTGISGTLQVDPDPLVPTEYEVIAVNEEGISCRASAFVYPVTCVLGGGMAVVPDCAVSARVNPDGTFDIAWATVNADGATLTDQNGTALSSDACGNIRVAGMEDAFTIEGLNAVGSCKDTIAVRPQ